MKVREGLRKRFRTSNVLQAINILNGEINSNEGEWEEQPPPTNILIKKRTNLYIYIYFFYRKDDDKSTRR